MKKPLGILCLLPLLLSLSCASPQPGHSERDDSGDTIHWIDFEGHGRRYEIHQPLKFDGAKAPLILAIHGGAGSANAQRQQSQLSQTSDRYGFFVIYPNGTGRFEDKILTWNAGNCCGYAKDKKIDDVKFIASVLDHALANYPIDPTRVYATGMSNGAMMTYRLGCELSNRITAIAPVGGTFVAKCPNLHRPMPVMHIHGLKDPIVPYNGGVGKHSVLGLPHPSVNETTSFWKNHNHCKKSEMQVVKTKDAFIETCPEDPKIPSAPVITVKVLEAGHVWPGGKDITGWTGTTGPFVMTLSTNELVWEFFKKYRLQVENHP